MELMISAASEAANWGAAMASSIIAALVYPLPAGVTTVFFMYRRTKSKWATVAAVIAATGMIGVLLSLGAAIFRSKSTLLVGVALYVSGLIAALYSANKVLEHDRRESAAID
ncbi:hypothetical protein KGQ24_03740 [Patescibacteria group bacterium]|nr:hypothetical protein [Patescibacteria group bacterium]